MTPRTLRSCFTLALVVAMAGASGCATTIHGTTQRIAVTSNPSGARAVVLPQNVALTTPSAITLERKKVYTILFDSPGYEPKTVYVNKQMSDAFNGNVILGGLAGMETDISNGAAFVLTPDPVHVDLKPVQQSATPPAGTPVVGAPVR